MFGIGMPELILILVVALIVIGPKKLPDMARSLGRALNEFKSATQDFKDSIDTEVKDLKNLDKTDMGRIGEKQAKSRPETGEKPSGESASKTGVSPADTPDKESKASENKAAAESDETAADGGNGFKTGIAEYDAGSDDDEPAPRTTPSNDVRTHD